MDPDILRDSDDEHDVDLDQDADLNEEYLEDIASDAENERIVELDNRDSDVELESDEEEELWPALMVNPVLNVEPCYMARDQSQWCAEPGRLWAE